MILEDCQRAQRGVIDAGGPRAGAEDCRAVPGLVSSGAAELGISLPPDAPEIFAKYHGFLEQNRKKQNLTTISGAEDVARLHFLDSIAILKYARFDGASVIDVGSGAGFPGAPLKIARPSIRLTLLDATGKRVAFLSELCGLLGLRGVECVSARAEEAARRAGMRERYDIAVSRAVAEQRVLCELCLPLVRVGGVFIAMKSTSSDEEIARSERAMALLGGRFRESADYMIPGSGITHRAVIIEKAHKTPGEYPRPFAKIKKTPL